MGKHSQTKKGSTSRQTRRSKERRDNIDEALWNEGGFYEGMPGVTLNDEGSRKMLEFIVTPEGVSTTKIFAHPQLSTVCLKRAIEDNVMIRQIVYSSVVDGIFERKTIWNWILRMAYKRWFKRREKKLNHVRGISKLLKKQNKKLEIS